MNYKDIVKYLSDIVENLEENVRKFVEDQSQNQFTVDIVLRYGVFNQYIYIFAFNW